MYKNIQNNSSSYGQKGLKEIIRQLILGVENTTFKLKIACSVLVHLKLLKSNFLF